MDGGRTCSCRGDHELYPENMALSNTKIYAKGEGRVSDGKPTESLFVLLDDRPSFKVI